MWAIKVVLPLSIVVFLLCCKLRNIEHRHWLAGQKYVRYSPFTTTTTEGVREHIDNARARGYALLEQQLTVAVRGIAVPVCRRDGELFGAISVGLSMGVETTQHALARSLSLLREAEYACLATF